MNLTMSQERLHHGAWLMLFSGILSIGLICSAMFFYAEPYRFFGDFLSAMGRTHIQEGQLANWSACIIFNAGLVIAGIAVGVYFAWRGTVGSKLFGIPLILFGSIGGLLLTMTGLIPFDVWPDGHNYSIFTAGGLISVSLILCGLQGDSIFSSQENNHSWLVMTLFVGVCWVVLQKLIEHRLLYHGGVMQQKLIVFYLWLFMIRHAVLLVARTRNRTKAPETL